MVAERMSRRSLVIAIGRARIAALALKRGGILRVVGTCSRLPSVPHRIVVTLGKVEGWHCTRAHYLT